MKVTLSMVLRGQIVIEVPDSERAKLESLNMPMDLNTFEAVSNLSLDLDDLFAMGDVEVDDLDLSQPKKSETVE